MVIPGPRGEATEMRQLIIALVTEPALTLAGVGARRARIVGGKRHPAGPQMVSSTASLLRLVQSMEGGG